MKNEKPDEFLRVYRLGFIAMLVLLAIFLLKNLMYTKSDPMIYFYTLGVTIFELSRITGAYLYSAEERSSREKGKSKVVCGDNDKKYEPRVTFIIPVKNEEKVIFDTINRCYAVDYPKNKLEVVVVNDGSTDYTWNEITQAKSVHSSLIAVDWKINRGKRHAMREAFRKASGEIVIQLDSDSYIEKSSLRRLIEPFKEEGIGAISAHTDPANRDKNMLTMMQQAYYFTSFRTLKAAESLFDTVFCCSGCCSAYRKKIVLPALDEWTNERFLSRPVLWGDDRSLTNLVLKAGYKTIYMDNVQAYTIVPDTLGQFIKQQIRWKKSWFVNSLKASEFIFKRDMFVALTYFVPLFLITLITPIIAFKALVLNPFVFGISPVFYIAGVFSISALLAVNYRFFRKDKYWVYMFVWTFLSITVLPYVLLYALADLRNTTKWGTR